MSVLQNSYNFNQYGSNKRAKMEAIVGCLKKYQEGGRPKLISAKTGLNHATTRSYLKELDKNGYVKRLSGGWYSVIETIDGVKELPKIHNIVLTINVPDISYAHKEIEEVLNDVKFRVIFGTENKKMTGYISAEPPLGYREFCFAVDKFKTIVNSYLGFVPEDYFILVSSCEFNIDYSNIRIEGCNAVTLTSVSGDLEKLYNKNSGLRSEVRVRSLPLEAVYTMLKGGSINADIIQRQIESDKKIDIIDRNVKNLFIAYKENVKLMKNLLEKFDRVSNETMTKELVIRQIHSVPKTNVIEC